MKPSLRMIRRKRKLAKFYKKKTPWSVSFIGFFDFNFEGVERRYTTINLQPPKEPHTDIYTELSEELGVDRRDVKAKALSVMYDPKALDETVESLKDRIRLMFKL